MLKLTGANRLYTDIELMERAAEWIRVQTDPKLMEPINPEDAIQMMRHILGIDTTVLRGFIAEHNKEGIR